MIKSSASIVVRLLLQNHELLQCNKTIARLELLATLILARLMNSVTGALQPELGQYIRRSLKIGRIALDFVVTSHIFQSSYESNFGEKKSQKTLMVYEIHRHE